MLEAGIKLIKQDCWLCQSPSDPLEEINQPVYYHCRNCDLIFIDETFIPDPEQQKKRYTLHQNSHDNEGYVIMFRKFIDEAVAPF